MAIIHVLDKKTDEILGTLSLSKKEIVGQPIRTDSLNGENKFDFIANASVEKSSLLVKRNRIIIQDEDGYFREYIINYARQTKRNERDVRSDASFSDLSKAKVIEPQTLTGTTSILAVDLALDGTEWTPGYIEFTDTQTITINEYTNPLALLQLIASTFRLEISHRVEISGNRIVGRFVDMRKQMAGFEGKEIKFGKDLVGVTRNEDSGQIVTALLGIGPEKEDGTRLTVLVIDDDAFQRWNRNGQHLIVPFVPSTSSTDMTLEQLRKLTQDELKKRVDAAVSYECAAVSLEHIFGREHEKIRLGQTVRIKDDGYQPPLYVEGRIQDVELNQATGQIKSFTIGNFIEYNKTDLEKQIAQLKALVAQKVIIATSAAQKYTEDYSEKKKVMSATPPEDTKVIWVKPNPETNVNIAHAHDGTDWVPLTTTSASDIVDGEMLFDRLRGGMLIAGGDKDGVIEVRDASNLTHTKIDKNGIDTNKITIKRPDGYTSVNNGIIQSDFAITGTEPAFKSDSVDIVQWWWHTKQVLPSNCNYYTFTHNCRYVKIQVALYAGNAAAGSRLSIVDNNGTVLAQRTTYDTSQTSDLAVFGEVLTLDFGVPTGANRSFYVRLNTGNGGYDAYGRIIRMWKEG
ncbi:phage tail spike protein [Neobacillus sp. 19]|uniref:phage tail spike protein n=1 Tax=Neobacillus sp. 19 TaxID=3394458 RepID=UPI003BF6EAA8